MEYFVYLKRNENMSIIIKRNTDWMGSGTFMTVKVNGEKVAKVGNNQKIELDIPDDSVQLSVSQMGSKSNTIKVEHGETIEITTNKWSQRIFILFNFGLAASQIFVHELPKKYIIFAAIVIIGLLSYLFVDSFILKTLDNKRTVN